ncbi:MAG: DEAD/DEAH box helicase [Bacteroidales bacterium]|nr:DEAD/DEAH box helicase [Bacteroidales bacterium]
MTDKKDIRQQALEALGFAIFNAMQEEMLKFFPEGHDMLLLAPTGSGKTLAYLLPLWEAGGRTLIIAPSRELVQQIADVWQQLHTETRCVACYGGHDLRVEQQQLLSLSGNQPTSENYLIVGTPGRLKDHIERGNIVPQAFKYLVIDEFDKSLELGFEEEMHAIIDTLSGLSQRIFTSATHTIPIAPWTGFSDYHQLDYGSDQKEPKRLVMYQVKSPVPDKLETLRELLLCLLGPSKGGQQEQAIVFANYREAAERIAHYLSDQDIENALYHGGLEQDMRDKSIIRLRGGSIRVLVSTDLASRGLDLPDVAHIIHYHIPQSQETYTHRNGRTARAGASGKAYVIVGPDEVLPEYFDDNLPYFSLKNHAAQLEPAPMVTVYIGRGKKEKISKGDVVGFFTKNGGLKGADLGRIDVMDHCSYVAIRRDKAEAALAKVKGLKIKGEKTHYLIVTGG